MPLGLQPKPDSKFDKVCVKISSTALSTAITTGI